MPNKKCRSHKMITLPLHRAETVAYLQTRLTNRSQMSFVTVTFNNLPSS